jgi:hypothetical protein
LRSRSHPDLHKNMPTDTIQAMGGKARAAALTKEELSLSAKKAAEARWANRPLKALHKGNFKEEFGIDLDCYVLDNQTRTAVLSERGMGRALGFSPTGGNRLKEFVSSKTIIEIAGRELEEKLSQPVVFEWDGAGREPRQIVHGFDAKLLINICRTISGAANDGRLGKRYEKIATRARIILDASANLGIDHLVYALAGYNPSASEVIAAFKLYVQEEAKKYESEFPNELYMQWHRLYDIPVPLRGKPWQFKHLTVRHIYYPLAKSNGKIYQLIKALKSAGGNRQSKLFQFMSEVGTKALRFHIGRVAEMAEDSPDKDAYERRIARRFGEQQELELVFPEPAKTAADRENGAVSDGSVIG